MSVNGIDILIGPTFCKCRQSPSDPTGTGCASAVHTFVIIIVTHYVYMTLLIWQILSTCKMITITVMINLANIESSVPCRHLIAYRYIFLGTHLKNHHHHHHHQHHHHHHNLQLSIQSNHCDGVWGATVVDKGEERKHC